MKSFLFFMGGFVTASILWAYVMARSDIHRPRRPDDTDEPAG